jgi:glycosyltransferase involved in cell wall biosynthesis
MQLSGAGGDQQVSTETDLSCVECDAMQKSAINPKTTRARAAAGAKLRKERANTALVVIGMHRSGTSVLTRVLGMLGAQLPSDLMPPTEANPDGYWESMGLYRIHDDMLHAAGSSWHDLGPVPPFWENTQFIENYRSRLIEALKASFGDAAFFVLKDPRISRFVPFIDSALREFGAEPKFIIAIRNPWEVARSLKARDGFHHAKGLLLWLDHTLCAERSTRLSGRTFVLYDALLSDWRSSLLKACEELGVTFPAKHDTEIESFIKPAMRHHVHMVEDVHARDDIAAWAKVAFEAVRSLAQNKPGDHIEALDQVYNEFTSAQKAFGPLLAEAYATQLKEKEVLNELNAKLEAREAEARALRAKLKGLLRKKEALRPQVARLKSHVANIYTSRSWRLTAPLRMPSRAIEWLTQNARRGLKVRLTTGGPAKTQSPTVEPRRKRATDEKPTALTAPGQSRSKLHALENTYRQYWEQANALKSAWLYSELAERPVKAERCDVKMIAYYLPQFHPISENDAWWGRGFTEWRNVAKAAPVFVGHYQPKLPGELGFYDLRVVDVIRRQAELARLYGVSAFCFHFYWFAGKRLLEMPLLSFLENPDIDIEFCLCWANESWTRRWDGGEQDILIGQSHSPEDDLAFIRYLKRYFEDPRYLKINGKPVLTVYRPTILPDVAATAARWRCEAEAMGLPGLYLVATNSFGFSGAQDIGFDALSEFPPNCIRATRCDVERLTKQFKGKVYRYEDCIRASKECSLQESRLWPGAMPSWDNTARRITTGTVYHGSTPALFQKWLENCIGRARRNPPGERFVVINAWNEWAEGAYLEPDQRFGFAWLGAIRNAITEALREKPSDKIVVVSHDAHLHGGQLLALSLVRSLATEFNFAVDVVILGPGPLKSRFEEYAVVHDLSSVDPRGPVAKALAEQLFASGHRVALVNTTPSGAFLETLANAGLRCTAMVHEMSAFITERRLEDAAAAIVQSARTIVFGAEAVRESFGCFADLASHPDVRIRPQGLYKRNGLKCDLPSSRRLLREKLGISQDKKIALGVGSADLRKGIDLFVQGGLELAAKRGDIDFVWLGKCEASMQKLVRTILENEPHASRFHFLEFQKDTDLFYAGSDVFVLSSREDPLPTVAFEAMDVGLPVVAFADAGGIPDMIKGVCGLVIPWSDASALARAIEQLVATPEQAWKFGAAGKKLVEERLSFREYVFDLLTYSGVQFERISVIVPNYNYGSHLKERLNSIVGQNYPIFELIVLDDASSDNSLEVVEEFRRESGIELRVVVNDANSGSVFAQWQTGLALARGKYIWIAEADDIAESNFISAVVSSAASSDAALTFTDSFQIDERGHRIGNSYAAYCNGGKDGRFSRDFTLRGKAFLEECLSVKNTVLNVSSVLWRRDALERALNAVGSSIASYKIAGDWRLYAELALTDEPITYVARSLNGHRRHSTSVTSELDKQRHLKEIEDLHTFIADRLNATSTTTLAEMKAYQCKIAEQFGLHGAIGCRPCD